MNICILSKSTLAHQMGGMELYTQSLSEMLAKSGHSVTVITTRHPQAVEYEEKNSVFLNYSIGTRIACYSKSWWRESTRKLLELHYKNKFDVILAVSFSGYYYARKIRSIIDVPIVSIMMGEGIIGVIKSGWNCIYSFKEFFNFIGRYLLESIFLALPLFWGTLKYSDVIVVLSKETLKSIQREFFINPKKIFVIYVSVDTEIFKPDQVKRMSIRKRYSLDDESKIILMTGIVHKQKGMHIGLKTFVKIKKKIPEAKMMIVGDGSQLGSLKKLSRELHIEKDMIFCGFVPNIETPLYYNAADLFLNPTIRVEGLPTVVIEAMACGLPVVITRIGGTLSTIDEGVSGFFVKPKDEEMLAEKSIELLRDKKLTQSFAKNARAKALAQFSKAKMAAGYLDVCQRLITKHK